MSISTNSRAMNRNIDIPKHSDLSEISPGPLYLSGFVIHQNPSSIQSSRKQSDQTLVSLSPLSFKLYVNISMVTIMGNQISPNIAIVIFIRKIN